MDILEVAFLAVSIVIMVGGVLWGYFKAIADLKSKLAAVEKQILERVVKLETKMELFWTTVEECVPKMLHSPHAPMMDELLEKVEKRKPLTLDEAIELKQMLETEFNGDPKQPHAMGYVLLIARLNDIIRSGGGR